jgi:PAS domain S-box-containing protein
VIPNILAEGLIVIHTTAGIRQTVFANQRFAEMCGRPAEDLIGRCISEYYHDIDRAYFEEHITAGSAKGSHRFEFFLPRSDGSRLPVIFSLRRLPVRDGQALTVMSVTDVSELKEAQRAVEERQAMIDADLALAERVQRSLFPKRLAADGVEVITTYRPLLAVGGDYAWVSAHEGRSVHVVVGDVAGHGIAASLIANRLAAESAHYAAADRLPADILVAVNRASLSLIGQPDMFCTAAAVRVDTQKRTMCFSGAGHPPAFLARLSGSVEPLYSQHRIMGVLDNIGPPGAGVCWSIENGDQLMIYTDGLPEARNAQGEIFGYYRLQEAIREAVGASATEMSAHILGQVDAFRAGPAEDDITLVVISAGNP